jgi:hypothetical protein
MNLMTFRKGNVTLIPFPTDPSGNYPIQKGDLAYVHQSAVAGDPAISGSAPNANQFDEYGTANVYPVRSASYLAGQPSYADLQEAFAMVFAGVAARKTGQLSGETLWQLAETIDPGYTLIATSGMFEYTCPAQVWVPGAPVGIYGSLSGGVYVANSQTVDAIQSGATAANAAIGVAVVPFAALGMTVTKILVDIRSVTMYSGIQAKVTGGYGSGQ